MHSALLKLNFKKCSKFDLYNSFVEDTMSLFQNRHLGKIFSSVLCDFNLLNSQTNYCIGHRKMFYRIPWRIGIPWIGKKSIEFEKKIVFSIYFYKAPKISCASCCFLYFLFPIITMTMYFLPYNYWVSKARASFIFHWNKIYFHCWIHWLF